MASRSFLLLGVLASLLAISQPAAAWGRRGHAAIAEIAETHLTPTARAQVKALLINDLDKYERPSGRHRLADIASWADEIRDVAPPDTYRGWHSRSNSVCSETLGPCPGGRCVDEKLRHYIAVLKNLHASHRERNEALKFVVHLVGDLHVPLHSGSNRDKTGHFPATLEGRPARENSTLHSLWDHELASVLLVSPCALIATVGGGRLGYLGLHVCSMRLRKEVHDGRAAFPPGVRRSGGHPARARIEREPVVRWQQQRHQPLVRLNPLLDCQGRG